MLASSPVRFCRVSKAVFLSFKNHTIDQNNGPTHSQSKRPSKAYNAVNTGPFGNSSGGRLFVNITMRISSIQKTAERDAAGNKTTYGALCPSLACVMRKMHCMDCREKRNVNIHQTLS